MIVSSGIVAAESASTQAAVAMQPEFGTDMAGPEAPGRSTPAARPAASSGSVGNPGLVSSESAVRPSKFEFGAATARELFENNCSLLQQTATRHVPAGSAG